MTPLVMLLTRWVPRPLVLPALALLYAAMMLALMLVGGVSDIDIVYVDAGR